VTSSTPARGGCQCGAVRYEFSDTPRGLFVCHCHECQKQSAAAFGISLIVPRAGFRVTQGKARVWSRPTDSGHTLECAFCADCGTRLWHQRRGDSEQLSVKGGSLDHPVDLRHAVHIWTRRKLPGVLIPADAVQFEGEPE
jgi:hypothetical protein